MTNSIPSNVRTMAWFNFFSAFRLYNAVAILYFAQVTGSYTSAVSIFAISTLVTSMFEIPSGVCSDLLGRRKTLLLGEALMILAVTSYAIGGSYWWLAYGAVLEGIAMSLFSGNNDALLYDSLKADGQEADYPTHYGNTISLLPVGFGVAAVLGAILLGWRNYETIVWLSLIPQFLALAVALGFSEPNRHTHTVEPNVFHHLRRAFQRFRENARLRTLSLASILEYGIGEASSHFAPAFFVTLWPAWAISLLRTLNYLLASLGMRVASQLMTKYGEVKMLIWGSMANSFIWISTIAIPTQLTPVLNTLSSFSFGTGIVAKNSLLHKEFSDQERATMSSLNSFAGNLVFAVTSLALGLLADLTSAQIALLVGQLCLLAVILLYRRLARNA